MTMIPQEALQKIPTDIPELPATSELPDEDMFRELMHFSNDEEEEKDDPEILSPLSFIAPPPRFEEKKDLDGLICATTLFVARGAETLFSNPIAAVKTLPPEIEALFEKMASAMIVMSSPGETETTIFLDHHPSSLFLGTQITIREFSTAPKAFNIEIATHHPAALAMIDAHKQELLSAFHDGNFNFSVHRLETQLQPSEDRPVLHRKESGDDTRDQKGGREQ